MWRLYHFTLCPFSRKVRFALAVKGVTHELVQERPWDCLLYTSDAADE